MKTATFVTTIFCTLVIAFTANNGLEARQSVPKHPFVIEMRDTVEVEHPDFDTYIP